MQWRHVSLIGVGLLGGSLGMALKRRGLAARVRGYVRRAESVDECLRKGAVDTAGLDLGEAVREADLVVLCTPLAQMKPLMQAMLPSLKRGALVTDVGSAKEGVVRDLEGMVSSVGAEFVGSHPMAGSERMGVGEARENLFERALCVVTTTRRTAPEAVAKIEALWRSVGGIPLKLSPELHDELVSRSSHLPHVVASSLARFVLNPAFPEDQGRLCANGFKDTTRIASGSPEMWRDICLANRPQLRRSLRVYLEQLQQFLAMLEAGDQAGIETFLREAKTRRDGWRGSEGNNSPE